MSENSSDVPRHLRADRAEVTTARKLDPGGGGDVTERSREVHVHVMRVPTKEAGA